MGYYSFADHGGMEGWVGIVGSPIAVSLPAKIEPRAGKVRPPKTDILNTEARCQQEMTGDSHADSGNKRWIKRMPVIHLFIYLFIYTFYLHARVRECFELGFEINFLLVVDCCMHIKSY